MFTVNPIEPRAKQRMSKLPRITSKTTFACGLIATAQIAVGARLNCHKLIILGKLKINDRKTVVHVMDLT